MTTESDSLQRLRKLRLWHWRELTKARGNAQRAASAQQAMRYHDEANVHLAFVQDLNDFFPTHDGDTAERDARRC